MSNSDALRTMSVASGGKKKQRINVSGDEEDSENEHQGFSDSSSYDSNQVAHGGESTGGGLKSTGGGLKSTSDIDDDDDYVEPDVQELLDQQETTIEEQQNIIENLRQQLANPTTAKPKDGATPTEGSRWFKGPKSESQK